MNHTPVPDPVRQAIVDGLVRRAAALDGDARQHVLQRLQHLRDDADDSAPRVAEAAGPAPVGRMALAGLSELVDRLGRSTPVAGPSAAPPAAALKSVAAFRHTWSRLRAEQRLRQALAQVPAKAGPLNSSQVVHRALQAMQGLSPAYLDAFLSHLETLIALEQSVAGADPPPRRPRR